MIKLNTFLSVLLLAMIVIPNITLSASDVFRVENSIFGNPPDVTPPSTPSIISATPVATSQIDIEWTASTDNVFVGRYELFRDNIHIATTSLTNYSDTGLISSTTYTYTVRSIDTSKNYSSTSFAVSTTTLALPEPEPEPPGTIQSTQLTPTLKDLVIEPDERSALFNWQTNTYSQFIFRWGRTSSYELGFVSTDVFKREHKTVIKELEPATTYEYEILAYNARGEEFLLSRDRFTTLVPDDVTPPTNVSNLRSTVEGEDVALYWDNPIDEDFSHIRILRNHRFFPTDPYAGFLVYEGSGEAAVDKNAFALGEDQYYTVFSYDELGNVSSGAVLWVNRERGTTDLRSIAFELGEGDTIKLNAELEDGAGQSKQELEGLAEEDLPQPLTVDDIEIVQNGEVIYPNANGRFAIAGGDNFTVRIPYNRLPEHLKTVTVTLSHPVNKNQVFSFLLRVNKDKTAYEATVAALEMGGEFGLVVDIFDFKKESLQRVTGSVGSHYTAVDSAWPIFTEMLKTPRTIVTMTIGVFIFFLIFLWLIRFGLKDR